MGIEFDEQLQSRLLAFQKEHGLVEDGTVGAKTWGKLVEDVYVGSAEPSASHTSAAGHAVAEAVDLGHPVQALAGFAPNTTSNVEHSKAKTEPPKTEPAKTDPAKTRPPKAQPTVSEPDRLLVLRIAGELGLIEIERSLNTLRSLMPDRFLEFGHARRGFVAGTTGFPLVPPTDPQDLAEWQRGEDGGADGGGRGGRRRSAHRPGRPRACAGSRRRRSCISASRAPDTQASDAGDTAQV
jgi:peptidoglycan hydrolase-like protein with peptidoglycan-binding domain